MFIPPLQPLRLMFVAIALFSPVAQAVSQEVTRISDSRVTAAYNDDAPSPLVAPQDPFSGDKRVQGVELGVILSAAYNDNIFLSSRDAQSDYVGRFSPRMAYVKGDKDSLDGGYLKVAYLPTAVAYAEHRDDNRIDHEATAQVGIRGKKAALDYSLAYGKLGDATADTGRQADRQTFEHVVRVAWVPREKIALELAAGQSLADYADRVLLDSREAFGEVALRFAYSPKTRVGLAYRAGRFEVDGARDQRFQRLSASLEWQPREKVRVDLEVGAERRKVASGTSITPVAEGRINWAVSEKTSLYLSGYRRETASAFSPGQNYRTTGIMAGYSQGIGENWTARLEAGAERVSYRQVDGGSGDAGRDDLWFVRPSLEYRLTEELGLEIFYRLSSNDSSRAGFGYDQQSAGVILDYKF